MHNATFQQQIRSELVGPALEEFHRGIKRGQLEANIEIARERLDAERAKEIAKPTTAATKLMLAHGDLHRAMAKLMQFERGLA